MSTKVGLNLATSFATPRPMSNSDNNQRKYRYGKSPRDDSLFFIPSPAAIAAAFPNLSQESTSSVELDLSSFSVGLPRRAPTNNIDPDALSKTFSTLEITEDIFTKPLSNNITPNRSPQLRYKLLRNNQDRPQSRASNNLSKDDRDFTSFSGANFSEDDSDASSSTFSTINTTEDLFTKPLPNHTIPNQSQQHQYKVLRNNQDRSQFRASTNCSENDTMLRQRVLSRTHTEANSTTTLNMTHQKENMLPTSAQPAEKYTYISNASRTSSAAQPAEKSPFISNASHNSSIQLVEKSLYTPNESRTSTAQPAEKSPFRTSSAQPVENTPYVSNASRTSSGERKQLAELRAQVQSDTDNSTIGTDRTNTTIPLKSRGSRFVRNKTETQQTHANSSARFTSPAKSVTRSYVAQPTQSSFIINTGGDTTGRDTEDLGLPVIVENGQVQDRRSSARRFQRVNAIRTPEEEKELWLLSEKLKAENKALRTELAYQQHISNNLQEQNSKIQQDWSEFKSKVDVDIEIRMTEMSQKLERAIVESTALKNEKEGKAHEISKLEAEMARLRNDFHERNTNIQVEHTHTQSKAQNPSIRTFRPDSTGDDPTLRPSVDPQQALAMVMSQLNEEIAELKEAHNKVASQYMALEPAMKKRMRKEFKAEMDRLLRSIERKSDQVYLLQDVHEGIVPYEDDQE